MSSDVLCTRRYSHCHRIHNPLLSIERLRNCSIYIYSGRIQLKVGVLCYYITTGGEDNQLWGGDAQTLSVDLTQKRKGGSVSWYIRVVNGL